MSNLKLNKFDYLSSSHWTKTQDSWDHKYLSLKPFSLTNIKCHFHIFLSMYHKAILQAKILEIFNKNPSDC